MVARYSRRVCLVAQQVKDVDILINTKCLRKDGRTRQAADGNLAKDHPSHL